MGFKPFSVVKLRMAHLISYSLYDGRSTTWVTVVIEELIHAEGPYFQKGRIYQIQNRRRFSPQVVPVAR